MPKPTIVTRAGKGSALTWTEGDTNLTNLRDATITVAGDTGSIVNDLNSSFTISGGTGLTSSVASTTLTLNLDNTAVSAGSYTNASITVDAQGRLTSASSGTAPVTSVTGGTGISITGTTTPTVALANTAVTPASYTLTNLTVDAQGRITAASSASTTGSGSVVLATSPTLTTPTLGVASATSVNKVAITAPATSATLTIADGKTLTASNTLTFTGTDASSVAFGTGGTVAYTGGKLNQFASTSSSELLGVISDETGTGALVFANTPTLVTPVLGTPTSGNLSNCTADGTNSVGFRSIPSAGSEKTNNYSLQTSDRAEFVQVGSGGSITVPNSTFAAGDVVVIYNNHTAAITITLNTTNAYISGTNTNKTSVSLATRGVCNILFVSATVAILTGNIS